MSTNDTKQIRSLSLWGAVFVIVIGTLLHFTYGWSKDNFLVGIFAPVNESPWEHMKLVFVPMLLFALIEYPILKSKVNDYFFALLKQIGVAIVFILVVFFIYTHFVGHSILAVDIASFIIGVLLAKWFGYSILIGKYKNYEFDGINRVSVFILVLLAIFFISATFSPPHNKLFLDPETNTYGLFQIPN